MHRTKERREIDNMEARHYDDKQQLGGDLRPAICEMRLKFEVRRCVASCAAQNQFSRGRPRNPGMVRLLSLIHI